MEDILRLSKINKSFPGVKALTDVDLVIRKGEVHALVGENGAGKSTLMKIISGAYRRDSGTIWLDGKVVEVVSPKQSELMGISIIYQELNLIERISVAENVFIGRYPMKNGLVQWKKMNADAQALFDEYDLPINARVLVRSLTMAQKQMVEIIKAVSINAKIIIMDEPTSSLSNKEVDQLMKTIKILKEKGIAIIFVSHKLEEIFEICDTITVMRDGSHISTKPVAEVTNDSLIADMVGRTLDNLFPKQETTRGEEFLRIEHFNSIGVLRDVSFTAYAGEVLGFSGLVGAGRTETMRALFGADPKDSGDIYIKGKKVEIKSPKDAIANGIAFVTEDRKGEGLILDASVKNNLFLATIDKDTHHGFLDQKKYDSVGKENVETYKIKTPSLQTPAGTLSGGNQQKVVIAKWVNTDADIYIFDEPTRGIDVGAKIEVYNVINKLCSEGKCVIMVSSELPEILGMSDRVIVMREGKVMGELDRDSEFFNQESIMKAAWGGTLS